MAPSQTRGRHGTSSLIPAPSVTRSGTAYPQGIAKATQSRSGRKEYRPPRHIRQQSDGPYEHFHPRDPSETLPFGFTYRLLSFVQKLLEQTLFYWSKSWLPGLLRLEGWETPEEGELNIWPSALRRHYAPRDAFSRSAGMTQRILESLLYNNMRYIRHAAVHRKPTPIATLRRMLADAQQLTTGLRDASRGDKLKAIAMALESDDARNIQDIIAAPFTASGDVSKKPELIAAPVAASGDGQRMRPPKPSPVTIDLTGDDEDDGKDEGAKVNGGKDDDGKDDDGKDGDGKDNDGEDDGGNDGGHAASVTTKPAERLIIDLTDDD